MKILFAGSPDVAIPTLEALMNSNHTVCGVVSQPAQPIGRKRVVTPTPVATFALQHGLPLATPKNAGELLDAVSAFSPDVAVVVAYGRILTPEALDAIPLGWWNIHFSALPRWRGAAPVQHALLAGDEVTGITVFTIVPELDAGPMAQQVPVTIHSDDTAATLLGRMGKLAPALILTALSDLEQGTMSLLEQDGEVTYAPKLATDAGTLSLSEDADALMRRIRAVTPEPGAKVRRDDTGVTIGVLEATVSDGSLSVAPGELVVSHGEVLMGTGSAALVLGDVQPASKRPMPAIDWYRGLPQGVGLHVA